MTVIELELRPIAYDPARREEEVFDEVTPDTDFGFHPGAAFPRAYDRDEPKQRAAHAAVLAGTHVLKGI